MTPPPVPSRTAWASLWAMVIGFFMILVDTTIVSVAMPAMMRGLGADYTQVLWVNSAYLLTYAIPLLITGRLGDKFGPRTLYLSGLVVFTLTSLWCALAGSITSLILARAIQGLGASMMTPQTMAVITRTFPADRRGKAMSLWGATAGVAMLVGPLAGGVLVDAGGWEWIFFVNVPVGVIGFGLGFAFIPRLPSNEHRFDLVGVALSAVGMFCLIFGIQEGQTYSWGRIVGPISVPLLIAGGVVILGLFLLWQRHTFSEPLVPLTLFRDRSFSLGNLAIASVGISITTVAFPLMLYAQNVRGFTPTQAAMLMIPQAILSGALAPVAGVLVDRVAPRRLAPFGLFTAAGSLLWLAIALSTTTPVWLLLVILGLFGLGNAFLWSPLSVTAIRRLPLTAAGAGSGVYNTTRQVGSVLGSAALAALMNWRIQAAAAGMSTESGVVPADRAADYTAAMAQTLLLPIAGLLLAGVIALFFVGHPRTDRV